MIFYKILSELKHYETTYESTKNECDKLKKQNKKFEKMNEMEKLKQNINLNSSDSVNGSLQTISGIIDSLENAFKKINCIDTIENNKNQQNINHNYYVENNQINSIYDENNNKTENEPYESQYQQQQIYYIESDDTDDDSYSYHNAIEQRLREFGTHG